MRRRMPAAVAIALCLLPAGARGHRLEERWTDAGALRFGATLASDGARIAIAGRTSPQRPGVVAVFTRAGEPLLRRDAVEGDFGRALLLVPDAVLVGAPGATTAAGGTGVVLRVALAGDDADRRLENPAGAPGDFGAALAAAGDELIVGAPGLPGEHGAVHCYPVDATSPRLTLYAPGPTPPADDRFGAALAANDDAIVVGAPADDHGARDAGRVFVFEPATGALRFVIPAPAPTLAAGFGTAVAVLPGAIAVGAPSAPNGTLAGAGGVWMFDAADGSLRARLTDPRPLERGRFGTSLALAGGFLAIGAPGTVLSPPTAGMVHVLLPSGEHVQTLIHPDRAAATGAFGATLAGLDDGTIVTGAPAASFATPEAGAVYRFGTACPLCDPCHRCDAAAGACVPDAVCRPAAWLLGDSITSACGSYVAEQAPDWHVENHGRPLDLAIQGLERTELLLAQAGALPHVAHAFLGTNDLTFARILGVPPEVAAQDAAAVMAAIRDRFEALGVRTAIGLPLGWPRDLRERVPDPLARREMEDGVRALRRALHPLRPTVNLALGNARLYDDLVHPSPLGCEIVARRILGGLRRLVRLR